MADPDSGQIEQVHLTAGDVSLTLLTLGCITQDWRLPLGGARTSVVLGYADPRAYLDNRASLGIIAGRVANRIAGSRFELDGKVHHLMPNDGPNHLHGGPDGLSHRIWNVDRDGARRARFTYVSPDGEGGYPGNVECVVEVSLTGHTVTYDMAATPDRPTPINLAQHNYYALASGPCHDQTLMIAASNYTPTGPDLIPTGQIAPLDGAAFDFRKPRSLAAADPECHGIDHNYVLDLIDGPAARLTATTGLTLEMETDQPGLQLYTATHLAPFATPLSGQQHAFFAGLCLEPQGFPNAVNEPGFPSIIATPDCPYRQVLRVTIG